MQRSCWMGTHPPGSLESPEALDPGRAASDLSHTPCRPPRWLYGFYEAEASPSDRSSPTRNVFVIKTSRPCFDGSDTHERKRREEETEERRNTRRTHAPLITRHLWTNVAHAMKNDLQSALAAIGVGRSIIATPLMVRLTKRRRREASKYFPPPVERKRMRQVDSKALPAQESIIESSLHTIALSIFATTRIGCRILSL